MDTSSQPNARSGESAVGNAPISMNSGSRSRRKGKNFDRFSLFQDRMRKFYFLSEDVDNTHSEYKYFTSMANPPAMKLDVEIEKNFQFKDENALVTDVALAERERKMLNQWTNEEKTIFIKKYLAFPKQFGKIAQYLDNKTVPDVVEFYFTHKHTFNLKSILQAHQVRLRSARVY